MSLVELSGLILAAAAGGAVNAVAGGGTLITFPTLLFFGTPSVVANATSTLALVIGTSGGIYGFRHHVDAVRPWLWRLGPASLAGGLLGGVLLTFTSNETFSRLVPFLILFATVLFVAQSTFKRFAETGLQQAISAHRRTLWVAMGFQFLVAVYGGYFGAGIGILMLATLGLMGFNHIHEMNALKTILGSLINLVAAIWFITAGLIDWPKTAVMTIGAIAGYYLGSHYSQRISQQRVRQIVTAIGFAISAAMFYREFLRRH